MPPRPPPLKQTLKNAASADGTTPTHRPTLKIIILLSCLVAGGGTLTCCAIPALVVFVSSTFETPNRSTKGDEKSERSLPATDGHDVEIAIDTEVLANSRVIVRGKTTLPPKTSLMVSIEDEITDQNCGSGKAIVSDERSYESELLGPLIGIKDGVYIASVTMPVSDTQPESVRKIIGDKGQHLKGPIHDVGIFGNAVVVKKRFVIGGTNASNVHVRRVKKELEEYQDIITDIADLLSRLEKTKQRRLLYDSNNLANLREWGIFIRAFQEECDTLRVRVDAIANLRARVYPSQLLGDITMMSLKVAFSQESEYRELSDDYAECLEECKAYVAEIEAKLLDTQ